MLCQVLQIRKTQGGMNIAHVNVGPYFGDVPAEDAVKEGPADLRTKLRIRAGRIEAVLRVYPSE
jgi:hypothetical protein